MNATETRDAWLTPAEAAEKFGVKTRTLINWVRAQRLEAQRTVGGHRRYRESDVEALVAELRAAA